MAIYDREERKLVVRIVYDGPVAAGKTTNLKQLCNFFTTKRRSELFVPEEIGGRTVFFDWLQIEAGFVGGHPLRCQFVTVPGQTVLNARRRHLLGSADAIVFVCDSTPKGVRTAQDVLRSFRELRGAAGMPLVIQANKQDLPGAATPEELAARFGLDADVSIVAARADRGVGVRETAVLAIRSAANRVQRDLLLNGVDALAGVGETGEALHTAMLEAEERDDMSPAQALLARVGIVQSASTPLGEGSSTQTQAPPPEEEEPQLPDPSAPSGHIWPAPEGRDLVRMALAEKPQRRRDLVAQPGSREGSGKSDVLIYQAGPWCLKTSRRRCFDTENQGRVAVRELVRAKLRLGTMLPEKTVLSLQVDREQRFWLWTVTPWLTTLRARMKAAEAAGDDGALVEALRAFGRAAVDAMLLAVRQGVCLDVHPSNFSSAGGHLRYLDDDITSAHRVPAIGYALLHRVEEYAHRPEIVEQYLKSLEEEIPARVSKEESDRLELEADVAQVIIRSDGVKASRDRLKRAISRCPRTQMSPVR
jgi:signal recognition particle receptor subunit beta